MGQKTAIQQGHAADGASRPQDRRFFDGQNRRVSILIYRCAATDAQPDRISVLFRPGSADTISLRRRNQEHI
jgi:hypothetical protein